MAKKKVRTTRKVRAAVKSGFVGEMPTVEQLKQRPYAPAPVVDDGQVRARAYRRQPLYITLSATSDALTHEERAALDLYRETHDRADRSYTKSCLDVGKGNALRPDSIVHLNNAIREARNTIAKLEATLGPLADTLRAVALDDRTFSDVAMERFGSRTKSWILVNEPMMHNGQPVIRDGKPVLHAVHREEVVPRSGRHREIIRAEYRDAVKRLAIAIQDLPKPHPEELWVSPMENGRAWINRGAVGPKGAYRLRGSHFAVAATVDELARMLKGDLDFPSYGAAKVALTAASAGRLVDVDGLPVIDADMAMTPDAAMIALGSNHPSGAETLRWYR